MSTQLKVISWEVKILALKEVGESASQILIFKYKLQNHTQKMVVHKREKFMPFPSIYMNTKIFIIYYGYVET